MTDYQEQLAECQANNKNLFASVGEAGKSFGALHAASVADGVLDTKTKGSGHGLRGQGTGLL